MVFIWKQACWTPHSSSLLLLLLTPPSPLLPDTSFQRTETGLRVRIVWCSGADVLSIGVLQSCCTGKQTFDLNTRNLWVGDFCCCWTLTLCLLSYFKSRSCDSPVHSIHGIVVLEHHGVLQFLNDKNISATTEKVIVLLQAVASLQRFYFPRWLHFNSNIVAHKMLCAPIQTNLKQKLWINCHLRCTI